MRSLVNSFNKCLIYIEVYKYMSERLYINRK